MLVELTGFGRKLSRYPRGESDVITDMSARGRVRLVNPGKVLERKSLGSAYQGRPQPPVYIGNLPFNEPANQHVGAVPDSAGQREDLATARMCPPATLDWTAGDSCRERRHGPRSRLEYNPVYAHKFHGVRCCHKKVRRRPYGTSARCASLARTPLRSLRVCT